jgi:hypothetical protein
VLFAADRVARLSLPAACVHPYRINPLLVCVPVAAPGAEPGQSIGQFGRWIGSQGSVFRSIVTRRARRCILNLDEVG